MNLKILQLSGIQRMILFRYIKRYTIIFLTACLLLCSVGTAASGESVICIAPLSNNTGDKQYVGLAEGYADMLTAALSDQKAVKVVERERLSDILKEHKLTLQAITTPETAVKVGRLLKADRIFVGGISKPKDKFIINVHAYEVESSRLVVSEQVESKPEDVIDATYTLVNNLCERLNVKLKPIDPNDIDKNPNASLHFMKGLGCFYTTAYDRAIVRFMKTVDCDPMHIKARLWMAKSFMQTKEYRHAEIELKKLISDFPKCKEAVEAKAMMEKCKNSLKNNNTAGV